jgi:hypothetical protein
MNIQISSNLSVPCICLILITKKNKKKQGDAKLFPSDVDANLLSFRVLCCLFLSFILLYYFLIKKTTCKGKKYVSFKPY